MQLPIRHVFHRRTSVLISVIACINLAVAISSPANQAEVDAMSAAAKEMYLPVGTSLDWEITNTILPLLSGGGNTFTDVNYGGGDGWDQVRHLERAKKMAQAYQDPASGHYQNAALHDTILALADYFINNWPYEPSWWWAAIGYPNNCNPVVMLMKDEIIASTTYPNLQSQTDSRLTSKSWDKRGNSGGGANDSDICTSALVAALLSNDYGYCTSVKNYCNPLFSLKTGYSDGLMSDSSFTQHNGNGRQFQMTSYGREYMGGFLELATMFKPSSLKFSDEVVGSIEDFYLSGVRHLVYHANAPGTHWQDPGYMDILQSGRGYPSGGWIDRGLAEFNMSYNIPAFLEYGAPRSTELQELQDIMTDVVQETVPANKMFWHQDMMTHQRPQYYTSARGTSTRTVGNEGRISEAAKSYHMGDGVNMVLHHGDEYDGIYAPWDWKRLPGTTIEQNGSALPANSTLLQWPGGQAHAGGVSDGTYGNYGFYFNEGGNNSKMEAYKSQFFFDDEYVCLGAGIDASGAGSDVVTTINQTMHKTDFVKGDGATTTTHGAGTSQTLDINQWAHHYDIGYLILDKDGTATASVDSQTGLKSDINGGTSYSPDSVTANIFNLTINHGSGSYTDKKYAYVVVPGLTAAEMDTYATAPAVEVLSNSTTVQAVHHAGLKLTSAHFYSAGSLTMKDGTILTTDKAVALLVKEEGSFLVISAADPKYQGTTTTITLDKELSGTSVTWNGSVSTIPIMLAGGGHDNGKSVSIAVVDESTGGPLDAELLNGSFQSGDTAGWDVTWNGPNLKKSMHAFEGSYALSVQHGASLHQFVKLQPNTQYALTYAIKTTVGSDMVIGVNDSTDAQMKVATVTDDTYQSKRMLFTTGAADTTVKVWLWHPGNQGSDAVAYIDAIALTQDDFTAPTPAAGFAVAPVAVSGTAITMTSVTGIDDALPVEYYFAETTGNPGGDDSGWQTSPVYIDSGLDQATTYAYTVTMRDAFENAGTASGAQSATTLSLYAGSMIVSWDGNTTTTPTNTTLGITGILWGSYSASDGRGCNDRWFGPDSLVGGGYDGAATAPGGYTTSANGTWVDVRFSNNSGGNFDLNRLVFDYKSIWDSGPQKIEVLYNYGGLDDPDGSLLATFDAPGWAGNGTKDYHDFVLDLQSVLTDFTLANGQSATFTIRGVDASNGDVNGILDNIAFLGPFPGVWVEPSMAFRADFEGSVTTDASASSLTAANLDAGSTNGAWTINGEGGGNGVYAAVITDATTAEQALMLGLNNYDATALFSLVAPLDGTTISLDTYLRKVDNSSSENRIVGLDSSDKEVFEIILSGYNTSGNPSYRAVGFVDATDTVHYLGNNLLQVNQGNQYKLDKPRNLLLKLSVSSGGTSAMDIIWNGITLTNGMALKDSMAEDLAKIRFVGDGASDWEGIIFDNIEVIRSALPPVTGYSAWLSFYGLSGSPDADLDYDVDGDGWDNLMEYALGGNPTNGVLDGNIPTLGKAGNALEYIYSMRADDPSLIYYLELTDNMVIGTWTNMGYTVTGTNSPGGLFNQVINSIPNTNTQTFIRLKVEK